MANAITSPNMNLPVPVVGTDTGPDWANNLNGCLTVIDAHNHSSGQGVQITPDGINISADLTFNNHNATTLRSNRFQTQASPLSTSTSSDVGCVYVSGVDLYYNDINGNQIRITQSGGISGSPGSISNLSSPASASYNSGSETFIWQADVNTPANMDGASYIFRNLTANSKGLTLNPPNNMLADYSLTLPSIPGATSFVTMDTSGNFGNQTQTLSITNAMLAGNIRTTKVFAGDQIAVQTTKITTTYTQLLADGLILADTSGGAYTITLADTTGGALNGYTVRIKKTTNDYNVLTVTANSGQQIDASGGTTLNTYEESITLVCNSDGNWNVLDRFYNQSWAATTFGAVDGFTLRGGSAQASFSRRVGDSLQCRVYFQSVDVAAKTATIELPSGLIVDTNKLNNSGSVLGQAWILDQNNYWTNYASNTVTLIWAVCFNSGLSVSSASYKVYLSARGTNSNFTADNFTGFFASNTVGIAAEFMVPISGWN